MAGLVRQVVRKETLELLRDGRLGVVLGLSMLLVTAALVFGWRDASRNSREREAAQAASREHWEGQGEKNPHVATHYGMWVFKPASALSALDPGVSPNLGAALKVEAHRQNLAVASSAEDSIGIQRFGALTAASVLQLLGPLVVAALGFALWSSERERGTLRLLRSSGVSMGLLLRGKAVGLALAVALTLVPAIVGAIAVVSSLEVDASASSSGLRLAGLAGGYALYFALFMGLALAASARATESRSALLMLVGFWGITALVVPRLSAEVGALVVPLPSQDTFAADVAGSLEKGLPDGAARDERVEAITSALMAEQGFSDADFLMDDALLQGIELRAEAAWEDEVFEWHVTRLMDAMSRQERVSQWLGALSPTLAIRSLSAALAGTDFDHHRDFTAKAEVYRRALVDRLNQDFAKNAGAAGWDYKAGRELWETAPRFEYELPPASWALSRQWPALAWLLAWTLLAAVLAVRGAHRQKVFA